MTAAEDKKQEHDKEAENKTVSTASPEPKTDTTDKKDNFFSNNTGLIAGGAIALIGALGMGGGFGVIIALLSIIAGVSYDKENGAFGNIYKKFTDEKEPTQTIIPPNDVSQQIEKQTDKEKRIILTNSDDQLKKYEDEKKNNKERYVIFTINEDGSLGTNDMGKSAKISVKGENTKFENAKALDFDVVKPNSIRLSVYLDGRLRNYTIFDENAKSTFKDTDTLYYLSHKDTSLPVTYNDIDGKKVGYIDLESPEVKEKLNLLRRNWNSYDWNAQKSKTTTTHKEQEDPNVLKVGTALNSLSIETPLKNNDQLNAQENNDLRRIKLTVPPSTIQPPTSQPNNDITHDKSEPQSNSPSQININKRNEFVINDENKWIDPKPYETKEAIGALKIRIDGNNGKVLTISIPDKNGDFHEGNKINVAHRNEKFEITVVGNDRYIDLQNPKNAHIFSRLRNQINFKHDIKGEMMDYNDGSLGSFRSPLSTALSIPSNKQGYLS